MSLRNSIFITVSTFPCDTSRLLTYSDCDYNSHEMWDVQCPKLNIMNRSYQTHQSIVLTWRGHLLNMAHDMKAIRPTWPIKIGINSRISIDYAACYVFHLCTSYSICIATFSSQPVFPLVMHRSYRTPICRVYIVCSISCIIILTRFSSQSV